MRSKSIFILIALLAGSALFLSFKPADPDYFFQISRSIDIFGHVYKEITMNYVDEVDPEKLMEAGIDGLLSTTDPYTNYIEESEGDEIDLITTGAYGGIGLTIGVRDNYITVISLMEGYSAEKQGILPGDRIVIVDDKNVVGMKPDEVRSMTRGEPGTEVKIGVLREGENDTLTFSLIRDEIQLKNVTFADFIRPGIGYIKLERFSRNAGGEVHAAIEDMKLKGDLKGIILDIRGNPGGLLDAAVEVVSQFVPRGSLIVSTHGRKPESDKKYYSTEEPLLPATPLIVLIDRGSASASEIVAGAIQDLDRGVLLGERSFGKGLVQTVAQLPYNNQLKITTAKYYTPSGRCIQAIDYEHRDSTGAAPVFADSARHEFKTGDGRLVYGNGGVTPDTLVHPREQTPLEIDLQRKLMYFKFANQFVSSRKDIGDDFTADDNVFDRFEKYLADQKFSYEDEASAHINELTAAATRDHYSEKSLGEIDRLKKVLEAERITAIENQKPGIERQLSVEILERAKGQHGLIAASLRTDLQALAAEQIVTSMQPYTTLLAIKKEKN
jgi:carboxyl-terminal processing protease